MSDQEFHATHQNKSKEELQAMARRHGYGKDINHYVVKHKNGQSVSEDGGAGEFGTSELTKKYAKDTPGQC